MLFEGKWEVDELFYLFNCAVKENKIYELAILNVTPQLLRLDGPCLAYVSYTFQTILWKKLKKVRGQNPMPFSHKMFCVKVKLPSRSSGGLSFQKVYLKSDNNNIGIVG